MCSSGDGCFRDLTFLAETHYSWECGAVASPDFSSLRVKIGRRDLQTMPNFKGAHCEPIRKNQSGTVASPLCNVPHRTLLFYHTSILLSPKTRQPSWNKQSRFSHDGRALLQQARRDACRMDGILCRTARGRFQTTIKAAHVNEKQRGRAQRF